ncbi:hypothetical protein FJTKL_15378 [Diaporthe vaccinii]|uniref:Uncharacterized protein n=1 Tax=Diaporthe vaccinii TaxID=105482 RepID=A0ABR4E553_9PEZI
MAHLCDLHKSLPVDVWLAGFLKHPAQAIQNWADLALQLGVDPPDQDKGQSAQKIQQYAVRLKVMIVNPMAFYQQQLI